MTHYCKYHPLEPAYWWCSQCRVHSCETCSPDQPNETPGTPHYCLLCNNELKALGGAHSAPAFWQRLGSFLQYPLSPAGLVCLLLALALPFVLSGTALIVGRVALLLLLSKYALTALEYTASGRLKPIALPELQAAENTDLALKLGVLFSVLALGAGFLYGKSIFWGSSFVVLAISALPAMVMAAAIDKNVASATQAEPLKSVAAGVGPVYVVLALLLLGLLAGLQAFVALFADILPLHISQSLALLAYSYFFIVLMTLTGYLLFQYQEKLGFTPAHGERRAKKGRGRGPDAVAVQLDIALKEGNYSKALSLLRSETGKKGATLSAHERYQKLLWALKDENSLVQHAGPYFKQLLESNRDMQALSLLRSYLAHNASFRPEDPDVCLDLAQALANMKEYKLAVHLLSGLHKDSPHYNRLPEAYLFAARILNEHLGLPQKAQALIQYLEGRFKTHASYPEIQAYKGRMLAVRAG